MKITGVRHGGTRDRAVHRREATEGAIDARVGVVDVGRLLIAHPAEVKHRQVTVVSEKFTSMFRIGWL